MTRHIPPEQLQLFADQLEWIEGELGRISSELSLGDLDQAAICLEDAWQAVSAAENLIRRRIRTRPAGWLNGTPYADYGPRSRGETGR